MTDATEFHQPLFSGTRIRSSAHNEFGTLTGLATRWADGKRVLVTARHV